MFRFKKMYLIERTNMVVETVCVNNKVSKNPEKNNAHGQSESLTNCEGLGTSYGFSHSQIVQCPRTC